MSSQPSLSGLPFEIAGVEERDSTLELTYQSETGASVTRRTYRRTGDAVRETDAEWMFNFRTDEWGCIHRFTHEYDVADDGTLLGDGSGWDGAGRDWRAWFVERHFERLEIRYQYDTIPEPDAGQTGQSPVPA